MRMPAGLAPGIVMGAVAGGAGTLAVVCLALRRRDAVLRGVVEFSLRALDLGLARVDDLLPPASEAAEEVRRCRELCAAIVRMVEDAR
jgi:hypothetical protein